MFIIIIVVLVFVLVLVLVLVLAVVGVEGADDAGGLVPPSRPPLAAGGGSGHGNQGREVTVGVGENQRLDLGRAGRQRVADCRGRGDG